MKVKELIEQLQRFDGELEVVTVNDIWNSARMVDSVELKRVDNKSGNFLTMGNRSGELQVVIE